MKRPVFRYPVLAFTLSLFVFLFNACSPEDDIDDVELDLQLVADGFVSPIGAVAAPDNSGRLFVIDQAGKIWIIQNGSRLATPFLDLTGAMIALNPNYDERGLLGLAFHPQYANNRKFYVYYQLPPRPGGPVPGANWNNLSRIAEFQASAADPNLADPATERVLLDIDDPQGNHNGGTICFGPDGYLYIAIGDGGGANDVGNGHVDDWYTDIPGGNGQDITANLFGDILRIDVNSGSPYGIPPDNPFIAGPGRDEIFAFGFRNPFRMSFDMGGDRALYVGDAGQALYEEINLVTRGSNYGWNIKEGTICFDPLNNDTARTGCPNVDNMGKTLVNPVIILNNAANPQGGQSLTIIGGNVYRGGIEALRGKYIFGNFSRSGQTPSGELFFAEPRGQQPWSFDELDLVSYPADLGYFLKGFGQDNEGEVYVTVSTNIGPSGTTGKLFRIVRTN